MKSRIIFSTAALLATLTVPVLAPADAVITLSNKRIDGTITQMTDDSVTIRTEGYGELTFPKLKLKEIIKGDGPSQTSKKNNPFYGSATDSGTSDSNPFGGSSNSNPFGGSSSANPFGGSSSGNPFDGGQTFQGWSGNTGQSVEINPSTGSVTKMPSKAAIDFPEPGPRREVTPPEVPFSWDAVVFEVAENCEGTAIAQPRTPEQQLQNGMNLRNGAEISTEECHARVVFKNGSDMLRITPHSSVVIHSSTPSRVEIELRKGSIWADVAPGSDRDFVIQTTSATISSREGVLRVVDALDFGFQVAVVDGSAAVVSRKAQIVANVEAGKMVSINPAGVLTPNLALTKIVRHEDSNFDTLAGDWWLRTDRLAIDRGLDETSRLVSMNQLRDRVRQVGAAFIAFVEDTGHIPTEQEAFSVLRENRGNWPGWQGPYWEGSLPPLDSWARPMRYTTRVTGGGQNIVGIVYSTGEDNIDNSGDPSADIPEMLLYYQLENINQRASARP